MLNRGYSMIDNKIGRIASIALLAVLAATPAMADVASSSIAIRGVVPTICKVQFGNGMGQVQGNAIDLGTMTQLCNDASGYRVVLHTPANLANATFVYGNHRIPLSASGETVIVDSNAPDWASDHAAIELGDGGVLPQDFALRVVAQPKGAIY